jgi:hypothetical protein
LRELNTDVYVPSQEEIDAMLTPVKEVKVLSQEEADSILSSIKKDDKIKDACNFLEARNMEETLEDNVSQLLTKVAETINSFEAEWQKTGEKYNLFKIADIADDEVIMCSVLADLLDPHGKHCQGNRYLDLFWKNISQKIPGGLALNIEKTRVTKNYWIKVTTEDGTYKNRFIDIALWDDSFFVPIEVKIGAPDQQRQVADYYEHAKNINKDDKVPLLYLTLDGHEPSDFSKDDVGENAYVKLTFRDDILPWLEACARETPKTTVPVRENLRQLTEAINSLYGKSEDKEMEDAIFKLITENTARAAMEICRVADFKNRAWLTFKGPVLELVKKEFPDFDLYNEGGWYYLYVPIKDGRYWFEINCLWDKACVQAANDTVDTVSPEGEALYEKMSDLFGIRPPRSSGYAWLHQKITWPGFAKDDLYEFRLCKLYTEKPGEVAKEIIRIAKELESVKV